MHVLYSSGDDSNQETSTTLKSMSVHTRKRCNTQESGQQHTQNSQLVDSLDIVLVQCTFRVCKMQG